MKRITVNPGDTLTAVLGGAPATTNPVVLVDVIRIGRHADGTKFVPLNGNTAQNLSAPVNEQEEVQGFSCYNVDTAAVTLSVKQTVAGTTYTILSCTLQVGDHLFCGPEGVYIVDTNGNLRQTSITTALQPFAISPSDWRETDGVTVCPAAAATTNFGVVKGTDGTNFPTLQTIDSKTATTSVVGRFITRLPANYIAGSAITLRFHAGALTTVADTSMTLTVAAYQNKRDGTGTANLVTTSAININSLTLADRDFTVTPTGLVAGDDINVVVTLAIVDGASVTAVKGIISHVELRTNIGQ